MIYHCACRSLVDDLESNFDMLIKTLSTRREINALYLLCDNEKVVARGLHICPFSVTYHWYIYRPDIWSYMKYKTAYRTRSLKTGLPNVHVQFLAGLFRLSVYTNVSKGEKKYERKPGRGGVVDEWYMEKRG